MSQPLGTNRALQSGQACCGSGIGWRRIKRSPYLTFFQVWAVTDQSCSKKMPRWEGGGNRPVPKKSPSWTDIKAASVIQSCMTSDWLIDKLSEYSPGPRGKRGTRHETYP